MSLRKALFWLHLAVGIAGGIVLLLLAVTGVILTYEAQLDRWALRGYRVEPPPDAAPLALDALVAQVGRARPADPVSSVAFGRDPREPAVVEFADGGALHVDRFTGVARGDGDTRMRRFLRSVLYWHRWFALEGEYRIVGRTFTATANLGFGFLIVSGLWLWWPAARTRAAWRGAAWFRRGLRERARDFNWHRVIGFWTAVPLAVIVASGATISYQWAAHLVYRLAGETLPATEPPAPVPVGWARPAADPARPAVDLQTLATSAAAGAPDWRTLTLRLPASPGDPVVVTVDRGTGRQPALREDFLFDRATGALVGRGGWPTWGTGFRMRRWLRFAHTGEVYGVLGQTIAGAASAGTAVLVWTGLAMSWRRFFGAAGDG